jgi:hypothetical protein
MVKGARPRCLFPHTFGQCGIDFIDRISHGFRDHVSFIAVWKVPSNPDILRVSATPS